MILSKTILIIKLELMKTKIIIVLGLTLLCFLLPLKAYAANNDPTAYPYKSSSKGIVDEWGFYTRYCTSYSAYKADEKIGNFHNSMSGPNGVSGRFGDAHNWNNNAKALGFSVQSKPTPGAIAVWESRAGQSGQVGHVAYVESVNSNGTFNISEYNWNYGDGNYNTRPNLKLEAGLSFISFGNSCTVPSNGDFVIKDKNNCELSTNQKLNGNLLISGEGSLRIKSGNTLDMNLSKYKILVKDNGKLLIEPSSKIN